MFCWVVSASFTLLPSPRSEASNATAGAQRKPAHPVIAHSGSAAVSLSQSEAKLIALTNSFHPMGTDQVRDMVLLAGPMSSPRRINDEPGPRSSQGKKAEQEEEARISIPLRVSPRGVPPAHETRLGRGQG